MIKAAIMFGVSTFGWFLMIYYHELAIYPGLSGGFSWFVFLALLPVCLAYVQNRKVLCKGPTILQVLLINVLGYALYTGLTIWVYYLLSQLGFLSFSWLGGWHMGLFYSFWQLLCWYVGLHTAYLSSTGGEVTLPELIVLSLPALPAVLCLTVAGFPPATLLLVIVGWFLTLTLSLAAVSAAGRDGTGCRYDIVLFQCLIVCLVAAVIFFAAFSGNAYQLLLGARKALLEILQRIYNFLANFYSQQPTTDLSTFKKMIKVPKISNRTSANSFKLWTLAIPFAVAMAYLGIKALLRLFRTRLTPGKKIVFVNAWSFLAVFRHFILLAKKTAWGLRKMTLFILSRLGQAFDALMRKIARLAARCLPPSTPDQAIYRAYHFFLRWGRRRGCSRKTSETPLEYAARLAAHLDRTELFNGIINQITACYLETCYRQECCDWPRARECQALVKDMKRKKTIGVE